MELTAVSTIKFAGVGEKMADKLAKLNIRNAQDILFHLPLRYEDRTSYTAIAFARPEASILVRGEIEAVQQLTHGRRSLLVRIADDTGSILIRLFHFSYAQVQAFKQGYWVECFGELVVRSGSKEMIHPEYRILPQKPEKPLSDSLTAVYPATDGVSQHLLRKITDQALRQYLPDVQELLPPDLAKRYQFISLYEALHELHRPSKHADIESILNMTAPCFNRLIYEELLALQMGLSDARKRRGLISAKACHRDDKTQKINAIFRQQLGFALTKAQDRVIEEIAVDLEKTSAMARLVQGDVGSGKTVVAAFAILQAVSAGLQVALMAPTELLAEQLFTNMAKWFGELEGVEVGRLTGKTKAKQRALITEQLKDQSLNVVVGTHALFQKGVEFGNLGMVVIDEQHRFGVGQRLALLDKSIDGSAPHQLIMSATPIPRTLAMSLYGDIDVSTIDELPPNRLPVGTVVVSVNRRDEVVQRVKHACEASTQVYWVCPLIDESEKMQAQAVTEAYANLSQRLSNIRVGMIHGQMKAIEKEQIMHDFRQQNIDLLMATTVIEVGVDVPNASLMIIENAERMGLAQLHQLRGRVGRGTQKSVCVLMYQAPLSDMAKQRLQIMRETNDGFAIARKDLELRGPGEMLGVRQTGAVSMRIANLVRDENWLELVAQDAKSIERTFPNVKDKLIQRWFAEQQQFANV